MFASWITVSCYARISACRRAPVLHCLCEVNSRPSHEARVGGTVGGESAWHQVSGVGSVTADVGSHRRARTCARLGSSCSSTAVSVAV